MVCEQCGTRNEAGRAFCGTCGSYLAWEDGPAGSTAGSTTGSTTGERPAQHSGQPGEQPDNQPDEQPGVQHGQQHGQQHGETTVETRRPPDESPGRGRRAVQDGRDDAAALVVPLRGASPDSVQPGAPRPPAPSPPPTGADRPRAGDVACPSCRLPNAAHRTYCGHCGTLLVSPVPATTPWWRRPFGGRSRAPAAGTRRRRSPGGRRLPRWVIVLGVLAVLALAGWLLRSPLSAGYESARDRLGSPQPVTPARITATSAAPGHPARALVDGLSNRSWLPAEGGAGQAVLVSFREPVRLVTVVVFPGAGTRPADFRATGRPTALRMTVVRSDGERRTLNLRLADAPGQQDLPVGVSDVRALRLTVTAAVPGLDETRPAIGELAFYVRS